MAAYNYTGFASITWKDGRETIQFIDFAADTGTLRVWPEDDKIEDHEFLGQVRDHPAQHMHFLHTRNTK